MPTLTNDDNEFSSYWSKAFAIDVCGAPVNAGQEAILQDAFDNGWNARLSVTYDWTTLSEPMNITTDVSLDVSSPHEELISEYIQVGFDSLRDLANRFEEINGEPLAKAVPAIFKLNRKLVPEVQAIV